MTFRAYLVTICAALGLVLAGCGDDGPTSEDAGSETGDGDGDSGDGDGDSGDGDGDGDGDSGDGDGDSGDGDGDGDGDPACTQAGDAYATFDIDVFDIDADLDWDLTCTFDGVQPFGESGYQISLSNCVSELNLEMPPPELVLTIDSSPATEPFIAPGIEVRLRWVQHGPFIGGKWFTLRTEPGGSLLLAGLDGPAVVPWDAPDFDFAPLGVELVSVGCELFEHDSQCGLAERQAFEVTWDGDTVTVLDKNSGSIGPLVSYQIVVGSALDFPELTCDDFPAKILRALFLMIPEG